jgi:hypothetical protein
MTSLHEMVNQGGQGTAEGVEGAEAAAAFLEALTEQSPDDVLYCINLRNDQRYKKSSHETHNLLCVKSALLNLLA